MRLVIITPPDDVAYEPRAVSHILQQSSATLHLRKPGRGPEELAGYLRHIPACLHHRIMVHDHPHLMDAYHLKGIHFTERQRLERPHAIRQLRQARPGCTISSAFHRIPDILEPAGLLDYIFLSPIFDSISKQGYTARFDHEDLKRFLATTGHTVFALGGVDERRIAVAASLGFSGVAVLGAVWASASPEKTARQLSAICRCMES